MPYQWSWSVGVTHQLLNNSAVSVDYVANVSRDQLGVIDINEPVNRVRPGVDVFDPDGELIPAEARGDDLPARPAVANPRGVQRRLQVAAVLVRQAHGEPLERAPRLHAAGGHYVGLGNPDARRVWLDNDIHADYGRFAPTARTCWPRAPP